ncbi:hypothetical protein BC831DRAFT_445929, partial [Entophlyctis helioformis]
VNKLGFLCGILLHGEDAHTNELRGLLQHDETFHQNEQAFISRMFDYYIRPFHLAYNNGSECRTPLAVSQSGSAENLDGNSVEPTHYKLKKFLEARDGRCLFCWMPDSCAASHIITQQNDPIRLLLAIRRAVQDEWARRDPRTQPEHDQVPRIQFLTDDPASRPNRTALKFHKAACLIWRMAGAGYPDEEYCCFDDEHSDHGMQIGMDDLQKERLQRYLVQCDQADGM